MDKCGCLPSDERELVAGILDVYAETVDNDERADNIRKIGDEVKECKCPVSSSDKKKKKKREPSAYNVHTGTCMKEGKTMKECAVEWQELKKK